MSANIKPIKPAAPAPEPTLTPEPPVRSMRILRLPDVQDRVGLKTTQLYHLMKKKQFPQSIKLSAQAVGWFEHEIDAYLVARAAQRPPGWQDENLGAHLGAHARKG